MNTYKLVLTLPTGAVENYISEKIRQTFIYDAKIDRIKIEKEYELEAKNGVRWYVRNYTITIKSNEERSTINLAGLIVNNLIANDIDFVEQFTKDVGITCAPLETKREPLQMELNI